MGIGERRLLKKKITVKGASQTLVPDYRMVIYLQSVVTERLKVAVYANKALAFSAAAAALAP